MQYANLPRPMIFAHRGASKYAPENTLAAFEAAIEQKADAIELDVHLTSDDQMVVIHDDTVDRTTNGTGKVKELTLLDLQRLDAGLSFHTKFKDEIIPTLEEVIKTVGRRIFMNIELKDKEFWNPSLPKKVAFLLRNYELTDSVLISSFNIISLRSIRKLLPEIPIALLAKGGKQGILARSQLGYLLVNYQALHPKFVDTTPELVQKQHAHGHRIHVHTVDQPDDMRSLLKLGVDGIFTNDPLTARKELDQYYDVDQENS